MAEKKPLVLDAYKQMEQLQTGDELPVQEEVDFNLILIRKLILCLYRNGIEIEDEELLNQLNYIE